jgi:SSS family solute:Na+ symporter
MWWLLAGCIGLLIMGLFFAKKVRKFAVYTLPELVEKQYDKNVGFAASILIVVAWAGVVAAQIVAAGKVLSIIGGSLDHWMFVFTIVFVAYAVLGGQHSIIRTDVLQSAILLFGIFASLFVTLSIIGGFNGLKSLPPDFFSFPVSTNFGFKSLLSFLIIVGATYVVGPDIYTRLFCADNERTAQNSTLITAFLIMFLSIAIALIGMSAKLLYPEIAPEQAFPQIIQQTLPFWLGSMVIAALIAAFMSSADTCILSQSVILTEDIVKRYWQLDERSTLLFTRLSIILLGLLALILALALRGVISSLLFAYTIFTCGLVIPVIFGFFKERVGVNSKGALAALIGGGLMGLLGRIPGIELPFKNDFGLIGFATSITLLFFVSFITRNFRG